MQPNDEPAGPTQTGPWWRGLIAPFGIFAAWWVLYLTALWWRGGDELAPYRNYTWWPSAHYLTVAQPGIVLQIFAHFMVTFIGGTFVGMLVYVPFRLLGRGDSKWQPRATLATYALVALYGFALVRGVPRQVTTIDTKARTLTLRRLAPITFVPEAPVILAVGNVRAIGTKVGRYASWRRDSDTVARLFAHMNDGSTHQLGSRDCGMQPPAACLEATDREAQALLRLLGLPAATAITTDAASNSRVFIVKRP
ncbi:MAG: hypothetical protein IPL79_17785 [Myxococcales bacterium]|nr:hypothetical protein [Myxococcales bacterium]